jgi:hypothetical protein
MSSTPNILEGAKKALDSANKFTSSVTGGKPSAFAPKAKAQPEKTDYSHAREARKSAGEFLGTSSDSSTAKAALDNADKTREAIKEVQ